MPAASPTYSPRTTQDGPIVRILREHLDAFLEQVRSDSGRRIPPFVERALRATMKCGSFQGGFARFNCPKCHQDRIIPFS